MPEPRYSLGIDSTCWSTSSGQSSGSLIGDMPPDSMPVASTAASIGAKLTLDTSSVCLTTPLRSSCVSAVTKAAANSGGALRVLCVCTTESPTISPTRSCVSIMTSTQGCWRKRKHNRCAPSSCGRCMTRMTSSTCRIDMAAASIGTGGWGGVVTVNRRTMFKPYSTQYNARNTRTASDRAVTSSLTFACRTTTDTVESAIPRRSAISAVE